MSFGLRSWKEEEIFLKVGWAIIFNKRGGGEREEEGRIRRGKKGKNDGMNRAERREERILKREKKKIFVSFLFFSFFEPFFSNKKTPFLKKKRKMKR